MAQLVRRHSYVRAYQEGSNGKLGRGKQSPGRSGLAGSMQLEAGEEKSWSRMKLRSERRSVERERGAPDGGSSRKYLVLVDGSALNGEGEGRDRRFE